MPSRPQPLATEICRPFAHGSFYGSTPAALETTTRDGFGWVRSHKSPGATRHSIHGSDVCASRPRATAAMPRRFHGATGGATARGAICGTYTLIASERVRLTGAGRFAGTNARKPKAYDG